jgi:hypothetical protein
MYHSKSFLTISKFLVSLITSFSVALQHDVVHAQIKVPHNASVAKLFQKKSHFFGCFFSVVSIRLFSCSFIDLFSRK